MQNAVQTFGIPVSKKKYRKYAHGTLNQSNDIRIEVNGLKFKPSVVVIQVTATPMTGNPTWIFGVVQLNGENSDYHYRVNGVYQTQGSAPYRRFKTSFDTTDGFTDDGFFTELGTFWYNYNVKWWAFGF